MTTPISPEQWQALRAAGHPDSVIMAHYHINPTPTAPPLPGPALPGAPAPQTETAMPCSAPDLSRAAYGVVEGRQPPEGMHLVRIVGTDMKRTQQLYPMGATFIRFVILESTSPEAEIGGEYSKAYSHNPADGFGRPLDDLKGWITHVVEAKHPEWRPRASWDNRFVDFVNGPEQGATGCVFKLRTEKRAGTRGRDFVKFDWGKGVVPDGTTIHGAPAAPSLSLPPLPGAAPSLPPLPGAAPALPPLPGASERPPGWTGAWPP